MASSSFHGPMCSFRSSHRLSYKCTLFSLYSLSSFLVRELDTFYLLTYGLFVIKGKLWDCLLSFQLFFAELMVKTLNPVVYNYGYTLESFKAPKNKSMH